MIYGYDIPYDHEEKCIYCDWEVYHDEVKDAAIELVQAYNAKCTDENAMLDNDCWDSFIQEAVEIVAKCKHVHTECDECHDFEM